MILILLYYFGKSVASARVFEVPDIEGARDLLRELRPVVAPEGEQQDPLDRIPAYKNLYNLSK